MIIQERWTAGGAGSGKGGSGDSRPWGAVRVAAPRVSSGGQHGSERSPCRHEAGSGRCPLRMGHQVCIRGWVEEPGALRGEETGGGDSPSYAHGSCVRMTWRGGHRAYPHQTALALPPALTLARTWVTRLSLGCLHFLIFKMGIRIPDSQAYHKAHM